MLCALYLALSLSGHSVGGSWPSNEAPSNWMDVSYVVPIQLSSFLGHVQLLRTYGAIGDGQQALTTQRYLPLLVVVFSLGVYYAVATFGYLATSGTPADNVLTSFASDAWDVNVLRVVLASTLLVSIPRTFFPLRDIFEDTYFAERKSVGRLVFRMVATLVRVQLPSRHDSDIVCFCRRFSPSPAALPC